MGLGNSLDLSLLRGENITTEENDVIKETENYYRNLYTSEGGNGKMMDEVSKKISGKLDCKDKEALNKFITEGEIRKCIKK